jgi:hypothetical protein
MLIIFAPHCHASDEDRAKLATFVEAGQGLYDRAAILVAKRPTTRSQIAMIDRSGSGTQWLNDERAFQESFSAMAGRDVTEDVREGLIMVG